jgi:hypothetical protein
MIQRLSGLLCDCTSALEYVPDMMYIECVCLNKSQASKQVQGRSKGVARGSQRVISVFCSSHVSPFHLCLSGHPLTTYHKSRGSKTVPSLGKGQEKRTRRANQKPDIMPCRGTEVTFTCYPSFIPSPQSEVRMLEAEDLFDRCTSHQGM